MDDRWVEAKSLELPVDFYGRTLLEPTTVAHTRGDLTRALASGSFDGLTGALRFGPDHGRADPPRLYVVQGDDIKLVH